MIPLIELPAWSAEFNKPSRYKVAYGGRGSTKSWTFGRMALLRAAEKPLRILCAREFQISIKDSVYAVLRDQIDAMKLTSLFEVGRSFIRGREDSPAYGTEFIFKGLRHNATEIKSTEGVDIAWVEEAESTSSESWKYLIPTIRKEGSEIWVTFNPDLETDPTYSRFVLNTPPDTIIRKVNHDDNPWLSSALKAERDYLRRVDFESYQNVWEGETRRHSASQVLHGKWRVDDFEPTDDWDGPYLGADWGFSSDPTTLIKVWIYKQRLYIQNEVYQVGLELDDTPAAFYKVPNAKAYTIYADSARPETISHMQRHGWPRIQSCKKWPGSVEDGIAHLRQYEEIVIHSRCKHSIQEARDWRWKLDRLTKEPTTTLHPGNDHTWDAVRYALGPLIRNRPLLIG